ncbi:MAG: peptide ABC transporter substrate-binding protein, partial [Spirochaetaceae bacterium]|nr:peptide ABC transporter substrate-binding protein [Spirochaetaceae bacterium]
MKKNTRFAVRLCVSLFCLLFPAAFSFAQDGHAQKEMTVAFFSSDITFNPLKAYSSTEAQIFTALYEGLVSYDPSSLEPVPAVARSWDISSGGKTYTFRLREDARYANGDPVTAEDFRASWLALLDPKLKAEYASFCDVIKGARDYREGKNPDPASVGIRTLSPTRLEVVLEEPATHFLKILCYHSLVPVHHSLLERADWSGAAEIIGNGPYRITERTEELILLEKNPHYWDAANVKTEAFRFVFIDDEEEVAQKFNNYEIHWAASAAGWNSVLYQDTIIINPLFATSYFFFGNTSLPGNNEKLRRALALLVPWEDLRSTAFQFLPATTLVPPIQYYPPPETIQETAREEALSLLEECGFSGGEGLPPLTIKIPESREYMRLAALMTEAWEKEGIRSEIIAYPFPRYYETLKDGGFSLATMSWIADFADPFAFLQMWTSTSNLNDARFADPAYDELIRKSMGQSG